MEGVVSVKTPEDRLCGVDASLSREVDLGYELPGRLYPGGRLSLVRATVDARDWKTIHISIHLERRALLLKTFSREEESSRSDIHRIPHLTLVQAHKLSRQ